jgi:hypothetical protein
LKAEVSEFLAELFLNAVSYRTCWFQLLEIVEGQKLCGLSVTGTGLLDKYWSRLHTNMMTMLKVLVSLALKTLRY